MQLALSSTWLIIGGLQLSGGAQARPPKVPEASLSTSSKASRADGNMKKRTQRDPMPAWVENTNLDGWTKGSIQQKAEYRSVGECGRAQHL